MTSRRARERANARPWEAGEQPEPDDHQHAGDFPERDEDEQPERCPRSESSSLRIASFAGFARDFL